MSRFTESGVEEALLAWLKNLSWHARNGSDFIPGGPLSERAEYGKITLVQRLHDALARLNPNLSKEPLEDAFRKLEGPDLVFRNRAMYRMLVDGVNVEFKRKDGSVGGAQVDVLLSKWISGDLPVKHAEHFVWEAL